MFYDNRLIMSNIIQKINKSSILSGSEYQNLLKDNLVKKKETTYFGKD